MLNLDCVSHLYGILTVVLRADLCTLLNEFYKTFRIVLGSCPEHILKIKTKTIYLRLFVIEPKNYLTKLLGIIRNI